MTDLEPLSTQFLVSVIAVFLFAGTLGIIIGQNIELPQKAWLPLLGTLIATSIFALGEVSSTKGRIEVLEEFS